MRKKVVAVLSGGLDSSALVAILAKENEVICVTVDYGQRHKREIDSARAVCAKLACEHKVVDLSGLSALMTGSSQTDPSVPVPHGHYAEESMKKTVVPNRNMVLLAVGGALAVARKADELCYAAHAGDHAIYPDCREEFVAPLAAALWAADWHHVRLQRPFIGAVKAQIVTSAAHAYGGGWRPPERKPDGTLSPPEFVKTLGYDIMAMSYSCYEGAEEHCGLCGTCQERRVAFRDANVPDPTAYSEAGLAKLPTEALGA